MSVAAWVHAHRVVDAAASMWANVFPKNAELLYAWLYLARHSDRWVHFGQWVFGCLGIAATMACGRLYGLDARGALMAGALFAATPTVFLQATTDYTDLAFASALLASYHFALRFVRDQPDCGLDARYALLAGIAGGLALGIKSSGLLDVAVLGCLMAVRAAREVCRRRAAWRMAGWCAALFAVSVLALGAYWYLHTWQVYGNPVYPFRVTILGHVVFPGQGSLRDLILTPNTPPALRGLPWWRQVWVSWTTFPTYYAYDMQLGGFGVQWTWFEAPALAVFCVGCLRADRIQFLMVKVGDADDKACLSSPPSSTQCRTSPFRRSGGRWRAPACLPLPQAGCTS
ncbi:MAG: glycosyltransferase family 39 protein [Alicyclobacillaceae bacterium]|nr:glycosyltransferase family 39 protein [Alicyclobacillaceae bacterium]